MRSGRDPMDVELIAVTKTVSVERVREALDDGLRVFGESKVQEAALKIKDIRDFGGSLHMIGHLQKNKARRAVEMFDLIHSVDSLELLTELDRHAAETEKVQRVLIEVKLSPEATKTGADEGEIEGILSGARGLHNVRVDGLMTIPPYEENPQAARPYFHRLKELAERFGLKELSMGMSHDFEVAIDEGATMVRIGSAIFGERVWVKT